VIILGVILIYVVGQESIGRSVRELFARRRARAEHET
jgi:hypothetical protein